MTLDHLAFLFDLSNVPFVGVDLSRRRIRRLSARLVGLAMGQPSRPP